MRLSGDIIVVAWDNQFNFEWLAALSRLHDMSGAAADGAVTFVYAAILHAPGPFLSINQINAACA